jgi:hypothetical protein
MIILQTVGLLGRVISSSQGRCLNAGQHKHRINTYTNQTSMPCVGFEPTIPASEPAKTVHGQLPLSAQWYSIHCISVQHLTFKLVGYECNRNYKLLILSFHDGLLLMIILFLGVYNVLMWAVLPPFRRYMLASSLESMYVLCRVAEFLCVYTFTLRKTVPFAQMGHQLPLFPWRVYIYVTSESRNGGASEEVHY